MFEDTLDVVLELRRKLEARSIEIRWPTTENMSSSSPRKSKRKGPGFQWAGYKVFDAADGDDPRHIDHNLSASEADEDTYIVRTFQRPRLVRVNILLDVSKSMNLGTKGTFKSLLGAVCAGCGIMSAKKVKDQASFVTFASQPLTILKARNAQRLLLPALVKAVEDRDAEPAEVADRGFRRKDAPAQVDSPDGGGLALSMSAIHHPRRSVVLLVSDFVNMNEDDWEALRICGLRNDTIAVFVQDRRERELPQVPWPGMHYALEDFRGEKASFWIAPDNAPGWFLAMLRRVLGNVTTREEFAENFHRHETRILERLQECSVNTVIVSTDEEDEAVKSLLNMLANKLRS